MFAYAAFYYALGSVRYSAHRNFVDLGIFAQTAAGAFGCFCNAVEGSHWAYHFSPILYLPGALMRVWPSAMSLVALQAAAGALVAPPVYAMLRRRLDRRAARLGALVVFVYPPLGGVVFNDFHENGLAPAAVAWMVWAFDDGRLGLTLALTALTLSIKEDQAIFVACAGAVGALAYRGDRKRLTVCAIAGTAAIVVVVAYIIALHPHAAGRFYAWNAHDLQALFPGGVLGRIGFLLLAFLPLLFLPFRTAAASLLVAPLAEILFSRMATTYTIGSHYAGAWSGYAFAAFVFGLNIAAKGSSGRAHRLLYWCIGLCVAEFAAADPLHPAYFLHPPSAADAALDTVLASLPPKISLATQEEAYTHLAATNPNVTLLPERQAPISSCYVLVDRDFPDSVRLQESAPVLRRLISRRELRVVRADGGIILYKLPSCGRT